MTEWVAVAPLVDDDLNQTFWHQPEFKVGDRVRFIPGECPINTTPTYINYTTGTIVGFAPEAEVVNEHRYRVRRDVDQRVSRCAACELELIHD